MSFLVIEPADCAVFAGSQVAAVALDIHAEFAGNLELHVFQRLTRFGNHLAVIVLAGHAFSPPVAGFKG